jgi:pimeloyl-ACP methyl ester carboxylesterase
VTYSPEFLKSNLAFVEAQMRREIANPTLWQVRAITLVVTADEDQLIPPGNSRLIASMIPGARFENLSGLGHRAIWEAPEEMAGLVIDFLKPL